MIKKIKKTYNFLSVVASLSLAISLALISPGKPVLAGTLVKVTRIGGVSRYETAAKLAIANYKNSKYVVLVSGDNPYDAISGTVLAAKLKAPLLLTPSNSNTLDPYTKAAISEVRADTAIIVGDKAAISQSVRDYVNRTLSIAELYGLDKYGTNLAVMNALIKNFGADASNILVVGGEGWSDGISVASVAAAEGKILLLASNDLTQMNETNKFVAINRSKTLVVATTSVIGQAELASLTANTGRRITGGEDRFATNQIVDSLFSGNSNCSKVYVACATGEGYADALVASALAGANKAPLILIDTENSKASSNAMQYLKYLMPMKEVNVLGGIGVVSDNTITAISSTVNTAANLSDNCYDQNQLSEVWDFTYPQYNLTINSCTASAVRNKAVPASSVVYKVTYTYKLLSKDLLNSEGFSVDNFHDYFGDNGEVGINYVTTIADGAKKIFNIGDSFTASCYVLMPNKISRLTLHHTYHNLGSVGININGIVNSTMPFMIYDVPAVN